MTRAARQGGGEPGQASTHNSKTTVDTAVDQLLDPQLLLVEEAAGGTATDAIELEDERRNVSNGGLTNAQPSSTDPAGDDDLIRWLADWLVRVAEQQEVRDG
jgi:hypothetical protein